MFMDIAHLSLKIVHITGIKNCTAEFRSCQSRDIFEAVCEQEVPVKLNLGVRTVRAERMMIANLDPRIEKLAEIGNTDPQYQMLIHHVENQTEKKHLEENSELKQIGVCFRELGIFTCDSGPK